MKSGAKDIICHFNAGGNNYFEWIISTSTRIYDTALSKGSFKTDSKLHHVLEKVFRTQLVAIYGKKIIQIKLISIARKPNRKYALKFRAYFAQPIEQTNLRTQIVSTIQRTYYKALQRYFPSATKSMQIPKSVRIHMPLHIRQRKTKAIFIPDNHSKQPYSLDTPQAYAKISPSR